ncbi:hypothetical protein ACFVOO_24790 [Streptomyces rochei]|uniref:hypothetical protein n=1 Tax=Streptomyces rochei TaxID=1928 RepID=UPI00368EFFAE
MTDRGAARWLAPSGLRMAEDVVEAVHTPLPGVRVEVRRCVDGAVLRERYTVVNSADESLAVTGLGIQTPFADWYRDARTSQEEAVHAHVFTGGTWAWVLAQPMSGEGRCLGLIVREGAVRAYSVESRNQALLSDVRGHLVLQVTDHVRNPDAFGGQPVLRLAPGESVSLPWELGWYESVGAFTAATRPPAAFSAYAAETGTPIIVEAASVSSPDPQVKVEREAEASTGSRRSHTAPARWTSATAPVPRCSSISRWGRSCAAASPSSPATNGPWSGPVCSRMPSSR